LEGHGKSPVILTPKKQSISPVGEAAKLLITTSAAKKIISSTETAEINEKVRHFLPMPCHLQGFCFTWDGALDKLY
jgi:hypothetical protein